IRGLADHVELRLAQQPRKALPEEQGVVSEHYLHGMRALMQVPAPGGLSTSKQPPTAATRSARPTSPDPPSRVAPPPPSSRTSTTRHPCRSLTSTNTTLARACLTALASPSLTTKYAVASTSAV